MRAPVRACLLSAVVAGLSASVSGCGTQHVLTASRPTAAASAPVATPPMTPSPSPSSAHEADCRLDQLGLSAEWEPGGFVYGTDPTHRHSALELDGRVMAVNHGAACVIATPPRIRLTSAAGRALPVTTVMAGFCRLACGAPDRLHLATGATAVAGLSWTPSYCGPDPGPRVRLGVALVGGAEVRVPVRNLGGAGMPVSAPSCVPALATGRLLVERLGPPQQSGQARPCSPPVSKLPPTTARPCPATNP